MNNHLNGEFKISGTGWLCIYKNDIWQPIMPVDKVQIAYWNSICKFFHEEQLLKI